MTIILGEYMITKQMTQFLSSTVWALIIDNCCFRSLRPSKDTYLFPIYPFSAQNLQAFGIKHVCSPN